MLEAYSKETFLAAEALASHESDEGPHYHFPY